MVIFGQDLPSHAVHFLSGLARTGVSFLLGRPTRRIFPGKEGRVTDIGVLFGCFVLEKWMAIPGLAGGFII